MSPFYYGTAFGVKLTWFAAVTAVFTSRASDDSGLISMTPSPALEAFHLASVACKSKDFVKIEDAQIRQ
jgi:hypothetical protein